MTTAKTNEREVSLFRNGRSQAVRIPKEFEMDTDTAVMWKDADGTIHIKPKRPQRTTAEFLDWLVSLGAEDMDWPEFDDPPPEDVNLGSDAE